jgi:hypothetical protein
VRNGKEPGFFDLLRSKEPRPQGGALKPYSKTKNEIPKQVRDDKKERNRNTFMCLSAPVFFAAERARNAAPYAIDFSRSSAMS